MKMKKKKKQTAHEDGEADDTWAPFVEGRLHEEEAEADDFVNAERGTAALLEQSQQQQQVSIQHIRDAEHTLSRGGTVALTAEEVEEGAEDANDERVGGAVPPVRLGLLLRVLRATTWLGGVAIALAPVPLALAALAQRNSDSLPHLGGFSAAPVWVYLLYALLWTLSASAFVPVGLSSAFGIVAALAMAYKLYSIYLRGGGLQGPELKVRHGLLLHFFKTTADTLSLRANPSHHLTCSP